MRIDWDEEKNEANRTKHGVGFERASDFQLDTAILDEDLRYDYGETRYQATGFIGDRLFVMVFTERGDDIRVISLRKANTRERRKYEQARRKAPPAAG